MEISMRKRLKVRQEKIVKSDFSPRIFLLRPFLNLSKQVIDNQDISDKLV